MQTYCTSVPIANRFPHYLSQLNYVTLLTDDRELYNAVTTANLLMLWISSSKRFFTGSFSFPSLPVTSFHWLVISCLISSFFHRSLKNHIFVEPMLRFNKPSQETVKNGWNKEFVANINQSHSYGRSRKREKAMVSASSLRRRIPSIPLGV